MRWALIALLSVAGCSKDPGATATEPPPPVCERHIDCGSSAWCVRGTCVSKPPDVAPPTGPAQTALLSATPASLNFGTVAVGSERTLSLVVENVGEAVLTLDRVAVAPPSAPFKVEPMGYGPFWIRDGRSRELFLTYAPSVSGSHQAKLLITSEAPTVEIALTGN